ncbi:PhnA domain-containing protein [Corallincola platygyrae]|uniref:PhnA domain-containing protein n=1 Tax=Corallincola platygyrae TaxID=1193278 RepID=A0ABW4XQM6_9GAMM
MSISNTLMTRCEGKCELCGAIEALTALEVEGASNIGEDSQIVVCETCLPQVEGGDLEVNHWHCLNESMWSQQPVVQVVAYRMLHRLSSEGWAQDLLDMMYLEDDVKAWADAGIAEEAEKTLDVNGTELKKGDSVTVIKDLPVKGSSQVIKQGTVVRGISLSDDPTLISGKANGQSMYLIAAYCRKK